MQGFGQQQPLQQILLLIHNGGIPLLGCCLFGLSILMAVSGSNQMLALLVHKELLEQRVRPAMSLDLQGLKVFKVLQALLA